MVTIIERTGGRYKIQDVEFGKVYKWHPERVVIECKCGKRITHKRSELISSEVSACECGADSKANIREELVIEVLDEDETVLHPWRYQHFSRDAGIPF
jgi:hypothetical protein